MIIGVLVAITGILGFIRYRERKNCKEAGVLASAGAIGGVVVGVCPICVSGILPIVLSFLGVSFSFASLPFSGIEMQVLIILFLSGSLIMLERKI